MIKHFKYFSVTSFSSLFSAVWPCFMSSRWPGLIRELLTSWGSSSSWWGFLRPCIDHVLLPEFSICGILVQQEGRDKRFLIQKLCQAQKVAAVRSPVSNPRSSSSSSSYHTSFSNNFNERLFLAHPTPDSATHVWEAVTRLRSRQIFSGTNFCGLPHICVLYCFFYLWWEKLGSFCGLLLYIVFF